MLEDERTLFLVIGVVLAVLDIGEIGLLLLDRALVNPLFKHATRLGMAHVDGLLHLFDRRLTTTEITLLQRGAIEPLGDALIALLAKLLDGRAVIEQLLGEAVVMNRLIVFRILHADTCRVDLALGLRIQRLPTNALGLNDIRDQLVLRRDSGLRLSCSRSLRNLLLSRGLGWLLRGLLLRFGHRLLGLLLLWLGRRCFNCCLLGLLLRLSRRCFDCRLLGLLLRLGRGFLLSLRFSLCLPCRCLGLDFPQEVIEIVLRKQRRADGNANRRRTHGDNFLDLCHFDSLLLSFKADYTKSRPIIQGLEVSSCGR